MPDFSDNEAKIISLFPVGKFVTFNGQKYKIQICGKPRPSSGECKTDVYLELCNAFSNEKTVFKISVKMSNADFLENKMSYERAVEIFGDNATDILTKSIMKIKDKFNDDYLIYFNEHGKTEAQTIKIGWKFELTNKLQGKKSGVLELTHEQKLDIYSGINLSEEKRNSSVNGIVIPDSGVAEYILIVDDVESITAKKCLESMIPINTYIADKDIYFACKAVNYRMSKDKWDSNRPLSVWVDWNLRNNKLVAEINMSNPLQKRANEFGLNLRNILNSLKITRKNFNSLKKMIDPNIKIYE